MTDNALTCTKGADASFTIPVTGVPSGETLASGVLTIREDRDGADLFSLAGTIVSGSLKFTITDVQSATLNAKRAYYWYQVKALTNAGTVLYPVPLGQFFVNNRLS